MISLFKNHKLAALGILASLTLGGCGGGGSSDSGAAANAKLTANISNQTTSNFSSISIEEHLTGKVFYSGDFECAAKQTNCKFYYSRPDITGPIVAIFKDAKGRIVGIYDVDYSPGVYLAPEVSLATTGAYLYEALVNQSAAFKNLSEIERLAELSVFTAKKDAIESATPVDLSNPLSTQTGHYEELALNYFGQQGSGPITVAAYIDQLAQRLIKREVAEATEFLIPANLSTSSIVNNMRLAFLGRVKMLQKISWINTAHAQTSSSSCTAGLGAFMSIFQGATGAIPSSFPIASGIGKTIGAIGFATCNPQKVKLDAIINQLNIVQNSLDNLSDDVGKLSNFVANAQMNTNLQDFTTVSNDLTQLGGNYQVITGNNGVTSLKEYVQKVGGSGGDALKNVLSNEPDGVFAKLLGRLPATSDQGYLLQIQRLTENQFDTLNDAMTNLCKNPSGTNIDIVKQRVQCNLVIGTTLSRLVSAQAIAYQLASDTYDLLEAYPTEATRYGYDLSKTATQNKAALKDKFDKQADLMVAKYRNIAKNLDGTTGLFNAFDGLPTALLSSMMSANCNGSQTDINARVQAILGWIKQGRNEYIVTNCKNFNTPILARYYIQKDGSAVNGNDVTNVMGVLIPTSALVGQDGGFSWRGSFVDAPAGSRSKLNLALQPAPVLYSFAVNGVENGTPRFMYDILPTSLPSSGLYGQIFKATGSEIDNSLPSWIDQLITKWGPDSTHTNVYLGGHAYIRYTDKSGYSVAFGLLPNYQLARSGMSMHCLTGDCATKYTGGSFDNYGYLTFIDGPAKIELSNSWFLIDGINPYLQ